MKAISWSQKKKDNNFMESKNRKTISWSQECVVNFIDIIIIIIIIIIRIPALKCSSSMLRPQLRLCRMAWVRGEGRESNKATNIYEIGHNNMKRTNLHMHDCTRMETTK